LIGALAHDQANCDALSKYDGSCKDISEFNIPSLWLILTILINN